MNGKLFSSTELVNSRKWRDCRVLYRAVPDVSIFLKAVMPAGADGYFILPRTAPAMVFFWISFVPS